ncbi:hypothetical protein GCM10027155_12100 [Acinetobacter apis]|uniref:Copper-binding protein CopC (Methionine-rich) n=2 Tax=Acinetobacter apis TaxID=1229165 RepID=A0A217EFL5_9GAMM|nr:Copper-binding protein CopC (methionine-rich) [Acinetobacter apis]
MLLIQKSFKKRRHVMLFISLIMASVSTFAHVHLASATPYANSFLNQQPQKITLHFSSDVVLTNVKLLNEEGHDIKLNHAFNHDLKKTFHIAVPHLNSGRYIVRLSIAEKGGHDMHSEYSFSVR